MDFLNPFLKPTWVILGIQSGRVVIYIGLLSFLQYLREAKQIRRRAIVR
jgi:hypothetical protein